MATIYNIRDGGTVDGSYNQFRSNSQFYRAVHSARDVHTHYNNNKTTTPNTTWFICHVIASLERIFILLFIHIYQFGTGRRRHKRLSLYEVFTQGQENLKNKWPNKCRGQLKWEGKAYRNSHSTRPTLNFWLEKINSCETKWGARVDRLSLISGISGIWTGIRCGMEW